MGLDIYGERLRYGYCEVHPDVHEEYPCSVCIEETQQQDAMQRDYERAMSEQHEKHLSREFEAYVDRELGIGMYGEGI